ncbi:MAG: Hsp20 family protein [Lactobacillales bacterium]|jgi:HSP20 family molecular chaperone IbpA|nr:Hsp20 family protein [Lactobacillales bacterium]
MVNILNHPFMLGFDELENMLSQVSKTSEGFPPYNIEQFENTDLRITLAVAGYTESDLQITQEDRQLIIRGRQEKQENKHYLHKGIAARNFIKSFVLAEGIRLQDAFLENGLLCIDLERPKKQIDVQKINIKSKKKKVPVLKEGG